MLGMDLIAASLPATPSPVARQRMGGGVLGVSFVVHHWITVTHLGAFDFGEDGWKQRKFG